MTLRSTQPSRLASLPQAGGPYQFHDEPSPGLTPRDLDNKWLCRLGTAASPHLRGLQTPDVPLRLYSRVGGSAPDADGIAQAATAGHQAECAQ